MIMTIPEILETRADSENETVLIPDAGRASLTYAGLAGFVRETVAKLNAAGIRSNDRVAVVLPNGPEMAAAFLGVSSGAACAPLNPAYRAEEFRFFLRDLGAQAVILPAGVDSPARQVGEELASPQSIWNLETRRRRGFSVWISRRRPKPSPMYQVMFQTRNYPHHTAAVAGLEVTEVEIDAGLSEFDLTLETQEEGNGLRCTLIFNTDLFDPDWAGRLLGHCRILLEDVVDDPNQPITRLPLLTKSEEQIVLKEWNDTYVETPETCVHYMFEEQAEREPDRIAHIFKDRQLTYRELNEAANRLASHLIKRGAERGTPVGIYLDRCPEQIISILAVLKTGGYYIPLDPELPARRVAFMLEDSSPCLVVTGDGLAQRLPAGAFSVVDLESCREELVKEEMPNPGRISRPGDVIFILYTSGSTGRPKGVVVEHRGVVDEVIARRRFFLFEEGERVLLVSTFTFGKSAWKRPGIRTRSVFRFARSGSACRTSAC